MKRKLLFIPFIFICSLSLLAQQSEKGILQGRIFNSVTNEPVPFAVLKIWGTTVGSLSDMDGNFTFTGLKPGYVRIEANAVGFENYLSEEFQVSNANKTFIELPMKEMQVELETVEVKASPFRKQEESPVSLRRIGIEQIEKSPGGNRDISKVIQSFPGVSSTSFRNDVIVRGGGPSENTFYLDGVEIPNLNHFATQGASGGPVGIINVDFIREVNFYSGAFPANLSNSMSSVLDMRQIDGNPDKLKFKGAVGASDLALTLDGPLSPKTTFIASARRSYLSFLFSVLELPFLPTYNDFQFKVKTRINDKNEISFIGLGAIDQFELNTTLKNQTVNQQYILSYLPVNEQWNYTFGIVYKHFGANGFDTYILSRNFLNNITYKYPGNVESMPKTLDYKSTEGEDKFRYEHTSNLANQFKLVYGGGLVYANYFNSTKNNIYIEDSLRFFEYETSLTMFHYNAFAQISKPFFNNRLSASFGLRADGSSYSPEMSNPFEQLAPRLSLSYLLTDKLSLNFNTGRYYQRPPYTAMGFKNAENEFVNKTNGLKYITSDHLVAGIEIKPTEKTMFSVEGFYKNYSDYPFSVLDSVSLSTKGANFGTYGDEPLKPVSEGRAYGVEVLGRSQDLFGFITVLSYTYVRSEFEDLRSGYEGKYIPTSWDNRHLLNLTATRVFKGNWFFGFKWRFAGGAPYSPWDYEKSEIKSAWDAQGAGYLNYKKFNTLRLSAFQQLDVRVDKQFFFDKWSLNLYMDIQNLLNFKSEEPSSLVRRYFVDQQDDVYIDGGVEKYYLEEIPSDGSGTILPTVGIIVEF